MQYRRLIGCLFVTVCSVSVAGAQTTFTASFEGEGSLTGPAGSVQSASYVCSLAHAGEGDGAQGMSYGMTATSGAITNISIAGTDAEAILDPNPFLHFAAYELTEGPGNEGAVGAYVFSFMTYVTLPANDTASFAIVELTAEIPEGGGTATLAYQDGLQGSGQPVPNIVSQWGQSFVPVTIPEDVELVPEVPDSDGDGIPDDEDCCPNSDLSPTVVIDGCDSGVENVLLSCGCTISDLVAGCAADAANHGDFVSSVVQLGLDLRADGVIAANEASAIVVCAAQAAIP